MKIGHSVIESDKNFIFKADRRHFELMLGNTCSEELIDNNNI